MDRTAHRRGKLLDEVVGFKVLKWRFIGNVRYQTEQLAQAQALERRSTLNVKHQQGKMKATMLGLETGLIDLPAVRANGLRVNNERE